MRFRTLLPAALLLVFASGCDKLTTEPSDRLPSDRAIVDAATARAALAGVYSGMQSLSYYGLDFQVLGDLAADNAEWVGTFQYLGEVETNQIKADNTLVTGVWESIYEVIARANLLLDRVPPLTDLEAEEKDEILGEAYFVRALAYHDLVKYWSDVPMPLAPIAVATDAAGFTRTPEAEVYTQILADLDMAASMITNTDDTRRASVAAVNALRARVLLYQGVDYQAVLDAANLVLAGRDTLTVPFPELFTENGTSTDEDIFRIAFTAVQYNEMGYYYLSDGREEVRPTADLEAAFEPGDLRHDWTLQPRGSGFEGTKFPTTIGAEHLHVIRLAEVVLIKAEALARLNRLAEAVDEYNKVRIRAGLAPHVLGTDVTTQADVLAAIEKERRLELALEGDRWPDLVRLGQAVAVKGLEDRAYQVLMPIPARERSVAPGLEQNPGY